MKHANVSVKIIVHAKKIMVEILAHICENGKYLKIIADSSMIACNEIIHVTCCRYFINKRGKYYHIVCASTMLTNSDDKKIRCKMACYILHTALLVIILLFIITIICYHYTKHKSKLKDIDALTI